MSSVVLDPQAAIQDVERLSQLVTRSLAPAAAAEPPPAGRDDGDVLAPIPGLIMRVCVVEGQSVAPGEPICVLEAMKMENEIRAHCAGRVAALPVRPGQPVALRQLLAHIRREPG
jgi:biotin carboxyl carrier protein